MLRRTRTEFGFESIEGMSERLHLVVVVEARMSNDFGVRSGGGQGKMKGKKVWALCIAAGVFAITSAAAIGIGTNLSVQEERT